MEVPGAIWKAVSEDDIEGVRSYLGSGGDPNLRAVCVGSEKETLLHIACEANSVEAIRILLAHGADTDTEDDMGNTPLHSAVKAMSLEAVRILLEDGVDPNAKTSLLGQTPLHMVADILLPTKGDLPVQLRIGMAKLLVAAGADPKIRDYGGQTAGDLLKPNEDDSLVEFFLTI